MRGFLLLTVVVLTSIAVGVIAEAPSTHLQVATTDTAGHPLPTGVINLANRVLQLSERHDLKGLDALSSWAGPNIPAPLEQNEVLADPRYFQVLDQLMTERPNACTECPPPNSEYNYGSFDNSDGYPRYYGMSTGFIVSGQRWLFDGFGYAGSEPGASTGRLGPFLGTFAGHERYLTVNPDGSFVLIARAFTNEDHIYKNFILDGENVAGRIQKVSNNRATVIITLSTTAAFQRGKLTIIFNPSKDLVTFSKGWYFCGDRAAITTCG